MKCPRQPLCPCLLTTLPPVLGLILMRDWVRELSQVILLGLSCQPLCPCLLTTLPPVLFLVPVTGELSKVGLLHAVLCLPKAAMCLPKAAPCLPKAAVCLPKAVLGLPEDLNPNHRLKGSLDPELLFCRSSSSPGSRPCPPPLPFSGISCS